MRLSVIIPVYNEEKTIRRVVEKIAKLDSEKEMAAVNDGSTDQTGTILGQGAHQVSFVFKPKLFYFGLKISLIAFVCLFIGLMKKMVFKR